MGTNRSPDDIPTSKSKLILFWLGFAVALGTLLFLITIAARQDADRILAARQAKQERLDFLNPITVISASTTWMSTPIYKVVGSTSLGGSILVEVHCGDTAAPAPGEQIWLGVSGSNNATVRVMPPTTIIEKFE